MKRVCLVSDTVYDTNGVSRVIQDFAKEAISIKKDFHVITSTKKEFEQIENIYNLKPLFKIKMPFYKNLDLVFPNFFSIKRKLKELNPDLLHISTPGTVGLCALISAKILKIPVVGIYHTDFPSYLYKNTNSKVVRELTAAFLRLFYGRFLTLFSRTKEFEERIFKDMKFSKERIKSIKHGINLKSFDRSFYKEGFLQRYGVEEGSFCVLYVGRVSVEKNIHTLLDIWERVDVENKKLLLVGDVEIKLDKNYCEKNSILSLGKKTKEELSSIYASSDCFIFPSTTDTLGQVVMEAMASALPVIVTNEGGPKSFVDSSCGFVLPIKETDRWVSTLEKLSKKDKSYLALKEGAYKIMRDYNISSSFLDFWDKSEVVFKRYAK